jgi:hypothetical protein
MLVVAHLPEGVAVTPEVAAARVLRVEVLGVDTVDTVKRPGEVIADALDDEVVVVRHQAESVDVQAEPLDCLPELGEEAAAVVAVEEDRAAFDAARGRVPDAVVGKRGARQPGHAPKLEPETPAKAVWKHRHRRFTRGHVLPRPVRGPSPDGCAAVTSGWEGGRRGR